tara:strand:+ start:159 stop:1124 length:966 start_codon:yes stop_codon:yes gene_type:complete
MTLTILIFIGSCLLLFWSGSRLVTALMSMARFLGWRKFVVAFFVMSVAGAIPNLLVGINSALHKIPQLSFGEIVGGNIVDLSLAVALVILIGGSNLSARMKVIQTSTLFTVVIAILPLILIIDGMLGRLDGVVLLLAFAFYIYWIFSKEERFKKIYNHKEENHITFKSFIWNISKLIFSLLMLLIASEGIVRSAATIADGFNVSLPMIGILIVGVGNALPETYFAILSAKRKQTEMILGDLMGSVIICATLVLGVVALIAPIQIDDFSPFAIARIFLIISALFFFIFVKTDKKITRKEALFLLGIYVVFVISEIYLKDLIF